MMTLSFRNHTLIRPKFKRYLLICLIFLTKKPDKPSPNINLKYGPVIDIKASLEIGICRNPLIGFHLVKFLVIKVGHNFSGFKAIKIGVTKENSNTLIFDKNQEAACPVTMELKNLIWFLLHYILVFIYL